MGLLNNDIVQATWVGSCFGQLIEMVRKYVILGDFPAPNTIATDLDLINTALSAGGVLDMETPYLACLPGSYSLQQLRTQKINGVRSAYRPLTFVGGAPGTNAGAASSANHSAGITCRTALAGRKQRGTVHVGPTPDAAAVAGILTAAYQVTLTSLAAKMILSFTPPTSGSLVIPILRHADGTFDLISTAPIQLTSRVQRRRTVGVGK